MIEDDPDVAFQRVIAAGATVVWSVNNQPFGWRVGRIGRSFRTPLGNWEALARCR